MSQELDMSNEDLELKDSVSIAFKNEYQRAWDADKQGKKLDLPENPEQLPLEDFKQRCKYLRPALLDGRDISEILALANPEDLLLTFPPKSRHCLAVIPFGPYGYDLSQQEINDHEYLKLLFVRYDGLTDGITNPPAYYYSILPKEIQTHCTFTIPEYTLPMSPAEKEKLVTNIKDAIARAYSNLRLLLDTEPRALA